MSDNTFSVAFRIGPVLIAGLVSWLARDKSWIIHFLTWAFGLPLLFVFGPLLVAVVSFLVFGIDLVD